jgi:hypothetical protein
MSNHSPVELIEIGLRSISLPSLVRPPVGPHEAPTEELVLWGIKSYAYSSIAHVRTVLAGLRVLAASGNEPTSLIVYRHIFEWAMHASYALQNFTEHLKGTDFRSAWDLFLELDTGNSWVKEHGSKYVPAVQSDELLGSVRMRRLVAAYTKYQLETRGEEDVRDSYGYLSEHAHAGGGCFFSYRLINDPEISFIDSPALYGYRGVVQVSVVDWTLLTSSLLGLAKEDHVRLRLVEILRSLIPQ